MPTRRVLVLALTCLVLLSGCPAGNGSDETTDDSGNVSTDNSGSEGAGAGAEPDENDDGDVVDPAASFVPTETFTDVAGDVCSRQTATGGETVECTPEFDSCAAGSVGDQLAIRCDGVVLRDGTVLSYDVRREALIGGSVSVLWACSGEPAAATSTCVFDVSEDGQSVIGGPCEYDGEFVGDALPLTVPTGCTPIPSDLGERIASTTDVQGRSSTATAYLEDGQAVHIQVGTTAPITLEEVIPVL